MYRRKIPAKKARRTTPWICCLWEEGRQEGGGRVEGGGKRVRKKVERLKVQTERQRGRETDTERHRET